MLRSKLAVLTLVLLCATVAGCTAGQTTSAPDPCASTIAIGEAILDRPEAENVKNAAMVQHIVSHPTCYKAETVASARVALVELGRQEQQAQARCPKNVTYVC